MELIPKALEDYAGLHSTPENALLEEVLSHTLEYHPEAHMISGHLQGRLLSMISRMVRPKRILEIGTFTGYSALCLVEGLTEDGILYTLEKREKDATLAQSFFNRSPLGIKIRLKMGDAMEILSNLQEDWDLVFLDADKTGYITYYEHLVGIMKPGSWIIADNTFFHGSVLEADPKGKNAKAINSFNRHVAEDERTEKVMLTVRDGLTLIRVK